MDHLIATKRLARLSTLLLLVVVPAEVLAQATPTARAEQIQALQEKLDALQSQMADVQDGMEQLSGGTSQPTHETSDLSAAIAAQQQKAESQLETELTPKQTEVGQATATYRTLAQDPIAAPRIKGGCGNNWILN